MKCNIEMLYNTIKAQVEDDLVLTENSLLEDEAKKRYSHEAAVLCGVLSMIENEDLLKRMASIYGVI